MKKHHLKTHMIKHDHILNLVAKQPKKSKYVPTYLCTWKGRKNKQTSGYGT